MAYKNQVTNEIKTGGGAPTAKRLLKKSAPISGSSTIKKSGASGGAVTGATASGAGKKVAKKLTRASSSASGSGKMLRKATPINKGKAVSSSPALTNNKTNPSQVKRKIY